MTEIAANGITLDYAEYGTPDGSPLVLIRGLGTQRTNWPQSFLDGLVARGFRVITFDNRDTGLSAKFDNFGGVDVGDVLGRAARGEAIEPPYTVDDMATDVTGLLDALGLATAHVVGISMGGMIVQRAAIRHAPRLRSVTSIMSSSGAPGLPNSTPEAQEALSRAPKSQSREDVVQNTIEAGRVYESPGYPDTDEVLRARAELAYDRCYCPEGVARQMLAIVASRGGADELRDVRTPTLVIHGKDDPLIPVACGIDTAERIPDARLELIDGMGHDIAMGLVPRLVELIADHALDADAQEAARGC